MKILKWLLYIIIVIAALVFIIPLFMPAQMKVSVDETINLSPAQVFQSAATFSNRNQWDPWLAMDPDAEFNVEPEKDYVGSMYTWNGKKTGTGKMVVDSVVYGKYIASEITFGKDPNPALVEWNLEQADSGTHVSWSFSDDLAYPFERLMFNMMKGGMKSTFESGLANFKKYLEANPPRLSRLGPIEEDHIDPMYALVVKTSGTMEEIGMQMEDMYGKISAAIGESGLRQAGAPFAVYTNYDEEAGTSDCTAGIPVSGKAKDMGDVTARSYPGMNTIQAIHYGPYEDMIRSYMKFESYLDSNDIKVQYKAFEFYLTDPMTEPDVTRWQTLIAFPLQ